jgi:Pentapeptide repeats (8 copies)/WD domain, G-beta repeat/Trypsin-like peptidase domain
VSAERAICRLWFAGRLVGLGFAVDRGHVVTCAHVVNKALQVSGLDPGRELEEADYPETRVTLEAEFAIGLLSAGTVDSEAIAGSVGSGGRVEAWPVREGWLPSARERFAADDVAMLELAGVAPGFVSALVPGRARNGDAVQLFGPVRGRADGGHVAAQVLGEVARGRVQLDSAGRGFKVVPGFSGGPVWLRGSGEVVGILAACGTGEDAVDAYMLDAARVARVWPAWDHALDAPGGRGGRDGWAVRDAHGKRLARVEEAARHHPRLADAVLARAGSGDEQVLVATVEDRDGEVVFGSSVHVVGVCQETPGDAEVASFRRLAQGVVPEGTELRSAYLVVMDGPAEEGVRARAAATRVVVQSFAEFQSGLDLRPFAVAQRERLDDDPRYAARWYVSQRYTQPPEPTVHRDLVGRLERWLAEEDGHLVVVLAPFGHGKTFLLHELARQMTDGGHPAVPVLIRMRDLEQAHEVSDLVMYALRQAGQLRLDAGRLEYLRRESRIALLFDGFDELARRVTYAQAEEHFVRIVASAQGRAKIVLTSRREHFLTDRGTRAALARRMAAGVNAQLVEIIDFDAAQMREFLTLRSGPDAADRWMRLLADASLLELAANPRMLELITTLGEDQLANLASGGGSAGTSESSGRVTKAALFTRLIKEWLAVEHERLSPPGAAPGPTPAQLHQALTALAADLWTRRTTTATIDDLARHTMALTTGPAALSGDEAAHQLGSGSLLIRTGDERFEFVHRSVWEWLVVTTIAACIKDNQPVPDGMPLSDLQLDLLCETVPGDALTAWVWTTAASTRPGERDMAVAAGGRAGITIPPRLILAGQDLRGTTHLARADLTAADLSGANLTKADLSGANLTGANLTGASLADADLTGTNLTHADLTTTVLDRARLNHATLTGARLARTSLNGARLCGATLTGIRWADPNTARRAVAYGATTDPAARAALDAAGTVPLDIRPMLQARALSAECEEVGFSPDGDLLATGHADGTVRIWDGATGVPLRTLTGHRDRVASVAWSPDGRYLASASINHIVQTWDAISGHPLRTITVSESRVTSSHAALVPWSPDSRHLATVGWEGLRIWDATTGQHVRTLTDSVAKLVSWSPDDRYLATVGWEGLRIWDATTGQHLRNLTGHAAEVGSVAWSPDGRLLATASRDGTARTWDAMTGRVLRTLTGHRDWVASVAWSPDGRLLATASNDGTCRLWDLARSGALAATLLPMADGGWTPTSTGAYEREGTDGRESWYIIGFVRFELGELDEFGV